MTQMVRLDHGNADHSNWFVVNWCLGNMCNYECSYCPKDLHDNSKPFPKFEVVRDFIQRTALYADSLGKKLYVELTGGEVTMWRHFLEIAEFCRTLDVKLGFISNGSRTLRYWQENKHLFDHVCLSFHPESADPDHFLSVVKAIHKTLRVHVNVMMAPDKFMKCYELAAKVVRVGNVSIALQPLIHDFGEVLYDYTPQQQRIFDMQYDLFVKHIKWEQGFPYYRGAMTATYADGQKETKAAHRFISQRENNWSGWDCYVGAEQLIVDMDGKVHRGWCKVGASLGTIEDPRFTQEPVRCTKGMCHCNFDIMATKVKPPAGDHARRVIPLFPIGGI